MPISPGLYVAGEIPELMGCIVFEHKKTICCQVMAIQYECGQCCQLRVIEGRVCKDIVKAAVILFQKFKYVGFSYGNAGCNAQNFGCS